MSRAFSSLGLANCVSLIAVPALLLGACLDHPIKPVKYDKSEVGDTTVAIAINKDVDILFIIDNSGSMAEEQLLLSANFKTFIDVLEADDVQANYRIGITTTDAGGNPQCPSATYRPAGGKLQLSSCLDRIDDGDFIFRNVDYSFACTEFCTKGGGVDGGGEISVRPTTTTKDSTEKPRYWIENIETQSNIEGVADNVEAFQCFGPQGVSGCGFEAHLESMYKALELTKQEVSVTNYDFLRPAAILSIVFVTDETDCSWKDSKKEIFTPSNKNFWYDPDGFQPSSATCWYAGVKCDGGPGTYSSCRSANYDLEANVDASDEDAVLEPVSKYINSVRTIEDQKRAIEGGGSVLVSLIAGVPVGYEDFTAEIPYEDSNDDVIQEDFGIGPGCVLPNPDDPENPALAVPPVREREFAEAFLEDPTTERNLYSICQDDYTAALQTIADKIRDQIQPACLPVCARDINPETEILEPECRLTQDNISEGTSEPIPRCNEVNGAWSAPAGATVCYAALVDKDNLTPSTIDDISDTCKDQGFNLEFILIRSAPPAAGTTISASCSLSPNKAVDCPGL